VKETMNILIRSLKQQDINQLNLVFKKLDSDHTGFISMQELEQGLIEAGINFEGEELEALLSDSHNFSGKLNYSQFLALTIDIKRLESTDGLWLAFKYFDSENRGFITKENFHSALKRAGWELSENEVNDMLGQYNLHKFEKLYFEQFCMMFEGNFHLDPEKFGQMTSMYTRKASLK
jgi:calcium-dependent protein kinase